MNTDEQPLDVSELSKKWYYGYFYNPYYGVHLTKDGGNWKSMVVVDLLLFFILAIPIVAFFLLVLANPFFRKKVINWSLVTITPVS